MLVTVAAGASRQVLDAPARAHQSSRFGLPSRLLVEASAQAVEDFIGHHSPVEDFRLSGAQHPGIHRVRSTDAWYLTVSPGTIGVEVQRGLPYEKQDAWRDTWDTKIAQRQVEIWGETHLDQAGPPRVITEWSRRSRARLSQAMAEIDHDTWEGTGDLAMLTLTLPNNWRELAPDGRTFKRHLEAFRLAWRRDIGPWCAVWKLEFQKRGAPHCHLLLRIPETTPSGESMHRWALRTWARICGATGRNGRFHAANGIDIDRTRNYADPARIAKYFLGHSSKKRDGKEYQHIVPKEWRDHGKGPGRFWGIAGVERIRLRVEIDLETAWKARRILRGIHRGRRASIALSRRWHAIQGVSEATRRATLGQLADFGHGRDRILRSSGGGGWVITDDSPGVAADLAHFLAASLLAREGP